MTRYIVKHEGIEDIQVPETMALEDSALANNLACFIEGAATAKFTRSPEKEGVVTITVIKQADRKGYGMLDVMQELGEAPEAQNPAVEFYQGLSGTRLGDLGADQVICMQEKLSQAVAEGEAQFDQLLAGIRRLNAVPSEPFNRLVTGF